MNRCLSYVPDVQKHFNYMNWDRQTSNCLNNEGGNDGQQNKNKKRKKEISYLQLQPTDHMLSCSSQSDEWEEHSETLTVSCHKILKISKQWIEPITKMFQTKQSKKIQRLNYITRNNQCILSNIYYDISS